MQSCMATMPLLGSFLEASQETGAELMTNAISLHSIFKSQWIIYTQAAMGLTTAEERLLDACVATTRMLRSFLGTSTMTSWSRHAAAHTVGLP